MGRLSGKGKANKLGYLKCLADRRRLEDADEAEAMQDASKFTRRVRKRSPTGAAMALLRVWDKVPEVALAALG